MTHKIVSAVVGLIVALFVIAALLFAWSVSARAPEPKGPRAPGIPHSISGGHARCSSCHRPDGLPSSHAGYQSDTCLSCHQTEGPPAVPHAVAGTTADCARCHQSGPGSLPLTHRRFPAGTCAGCHQQQRAGTIPHGVSMGETRCVLCHGESTAPLSMPVSHRAFAEISCTFCHQPGDARASLQPPPAGESAKKAPAIRHSLNGLLRDCLSCHQIGGRPSMPASHRGFGAGTCRFVCHFRPAGP